MGISDKRFQELSALSFFQDKKKELQSISKKSGFSMAEVRGFICDIRSSIDAKELVPATSEISEERRNQLAFWSLVKDNKMSLLSSKKLNSQSVFEVAFVVVLEETEKKVAFFSSVLGISIEESSEFTCELIRRILEEA